MAKKRTAATRPRPKKTAKKKRARAKQKATRASRGLKKRKARPSKRVHKAAATMLAAPDPDLPNLNKIDHIVVLMMENRSFDHLLGYLSLELGKAVNGLAAGMSNTFNGNTYPIHRLSNTAFPDGLDPCHSGACVAAQLANNNDGFVANFAQNYAQADPALVMGYYNDAAVPVYDFLAKRFCICDSWFSSVPGATWPNRLYSLAGRAAGSKDNKSIPFYSLPTFVRHLEANRVSWNWYAFQPATLRLVDPKFRLGFQHFHWVKHPFLRSFLRDAAAGNLASVSWIDPDFSDLGFTGNDDHPPADLKHGQELAFEIVHAVTTGPKWNKTLLVIVYDEHGGLYDHERPVTADDDDPSFRSYGLRVPAFIISPWATPGDVSHTTFDHTSLIKTILLRFCRDAAGAIPNMGARVNAANHLGSTLRELVATPPIDWSHMIALVTSWKAQQFQTQFVPEAEIRAQPRERNDLQSGLAKARKKLAALGHPEHLP